MDEMDYWRLCDELTIDQAAHLLIGCPPNMNDAMASIGADLTERSQTSYVLNLEAATTAITTALRLGNIKGQCSSHNEKYTDEDSAEKNGELINVYNTIVDVKSLRSWLTSRGFKTGFFFPEQEETMDYLDPLNPRYAPKLAASVKAWQSVTDAGKRSPKQALDKWLREHAVEFNLTNDEGRPIENAIEECSKVANWNAKGGATKTPS